MVRYLIIFLFLFLCVPCHSQNILNGTIISSESNSPIVFAHVQILDSSIGTVTNSEGKFSIYIPDGHKKSMIKVSSIGYQSYNINISTIDIEENILIEITPTVEQLDEVIVNFKQALSADEIVIKAFNNYKSKSKSLKYPYYAKCFVRHTEKEKKEYKWLVEAAFNIYDVGSKENVKINIIENRKSFDNRSIDTVKVMRQYLTDANNSSFKKNNKKAYDYKNQFTELELENAFSYYDNHFTNGYNKKLGLLEQILSGNNILRNYNQKKGLFTAKNLGDFTFKKDSSYYLDDERIYKIKYTRLNKKSKTIDAGWIYISDSDYRIIQINHSLILAKSHHYRKVTGIKVRRSIEIRYQNHNDNIYPKYFSLKTYKSSSYNLNNNIINVLFTHQEILFNEIVQDKNSAKKLFENFQSNDNNLFAKRDYNASFWEQYNILLETEEQKKLFKDLEKKVNLKEQFKKQ